MRISDIFLFSLAAVRPVYGQEGTYLKTATGSYLGYTTVSRSAMIALAVDDRSKASKASINDQGNLEIEIEGGKTKAAMTLTDLSGGPGNVNEVLFGYGTPTKGFSFGKNGSLILDQQGFHGFFACNDEGDGVQMYWANKETKAPTNCEALSFSKVAA